MMKKLIAFALALTMVLASAACAESARIVTYSAPYLQLTADGETHETDLSGMSLRAASGATEGVPTIQAELLKKGKVVERGQVQCADGRITIQAEGLSNAYALDLSQYGPQAQAAAVRLFGALDRLMELKLPGFEGMKLPMVDMTVIAPLVGSVPTTTAKGNKTAKLEVPYFMVKSLLTMANQYRDSVPAAAQSYAGPLFSLLDGMVKSDSGFALKGKVTTTSKYSTLSLKVYMVNGGVTSDAAAAKVKITSKKNSVKITVDMLQGESSVNAVTFSLTSKTKKPRLSFSLDVMSLFLAEGSLYREDGAQVLSLELDSMGQKLSAGASYGTEGDADYLELKLDVPNQVDLSASARVADDGNGGRAGASAVNVRTYGDHPLGVSLTGDVTESRGEVEFFRIRQTGGTVDLLHMTEQQSKQLDKELNRLVDKFLDRSRIGG